MLWNTKRSDYHSQPAATQCTALLDRSQANQTKTMQQSSHYVHQFQLCLFDCWNMYLTLNMFWIQTYPIILYCGVPLFTSHQARKIYKAWNFQKRLSLRLDRCVQHVSLRSTQEKLGRRAGGGGLEPERSVIISHTNPWQSKSRWGGGWYAVVYALRNSEARNHVLSQPKSQKGEERQPRCGITFFTEKKKCKKKGLPTDQYTMAVSAPLRSSTICLRDTVSNTRIRVPCNGKRTQNAHYTKPEKQQQQ